MVIRVILFAAAKEIVGQERLELTLDDSATLDDVKNALIQSYPAIEEIARKSVFSVDQVYTHENCQLHHGAEVGLIPPVSGG
jgi:molybdopterin converting factor subunit 1